MTFATLDHIYYWVHDMDVAVAFYSDVVGLDLKSRHGDEWAEFDASPLTLALHKVRGPNTGSGTVVFKVEDLDAARWTLEERGATFDEFVGEVQGFARFATFRDPDGNPIQIIEYLSKT